MPTAAAQRRFPVMGSDGHLVVVGPDADRADLLVDRGVDRLARLEARWSRFLPDSELSQLNRATGHPLLVSADTLVLVDALRKGWELTGGRFDPTVHDAMCDLGYTTSWPDLAATVRLPGRHAVPGCGGLEVQPESGLVRLPRGVRLDPGGLGKGLAADLVAGELMEAGAHGVLVNVGGDLRVMGTAPAGDAWTIGIDGPVPGSGRIASVELADGGVATSTSARRRWRSADGTELHHLLDPVTARPADRPWCQVTAVSATAWWAEVLAIVAFLDGDLGDDDSAAALVVGADGSLGQLGRPGWFANADPAPAPPAVGVAGAQEAWS